MNYFIIAVYVILSVSGLVCFKLGNEEALDFYVSSTFLSVKLSWLSILGLFIYVISFIIYMVLVSKNDFSYLMPVTTGAVYILTMLSSVLIFKENIHNIQLLGIALVFIGVLLINIFSNR